jgi:hypothetical protein
VTKRVVGVFIALQLDLLLIASHWLGGEKMMQEEEEKRKVETEEKVE